VMKMTLASITKSNAKANQRNVQVVVEPSIFAQTTHTAIHA
jgi:hypothetical protein